MNQTSHRSEGMKKILTEETAGIVGWMQGRRNGAILEVSRVESDAADANEPGCIRPKGFLHTLSAFTLIELMIVVGVIALLVAMLFPVISMITERAARSTCANNLRQIGIGDRAYAGENQGMLMLRNSANIDGLHRLANLSWPGSGGNSLIDNTVVNNLTDYFPGRALFCPQFYMRFKAGQNGGPYPAGTEWDESFLNLYGRNDNRTGYAWFRAAWENTGVAGVGRFEASSPGRHNDIKLFGGKKGNERREIDLAPSAARISEAYVNVNNYLLNNPDIASYTGWWHLGAGGKPAGGNILYGDLRVAWSGTLLTGLPGAESLSFPEPK